MPTKLYGGVARTTINPLLGTRKIGMRLFGDPVQAIESDLTATILVVDDTTARVALVACDLCAIPPPVISELRQRISEDIDTPISHVMINESHTHSSPAFPGYSLDIPEQLALKKNYQDSFMHKVIEAANEAFRKLNPVRIGTGWGNCEIGVYRREKNSHGQEILGAVPEALIDPSVGVIRIDDLKGNPVSILFSYGCHPVTTGPRSMVASSDYPGAARTIVENALGGKAIFLQACGGNVNPKSGIGFEVDCRDAKNRMGAMLAGEVLKVASDIRTHVQPAERTTLGTVPNILFTPLIPVKNDTPGTVKATEETVKLRMIQLPDMDTAEAIQRTWHQTLADKRNSDAPEWEIQTACRYCQWAENLVEAVRKNDTTIDMGIQVIRINDIAIAGITAEVFFETGLTIKSKSPAAHTQVLGYTNGLKCYLPRAEDFPENGWSLDGNYAWPDLMFQAFGLPTAIHPEAEQVIVERTLELIKSQI